MVRFIALLLAFATPSFAQMTGEEFDAYVTGNTLTYSDQGVTYGIEQYLPNRKVRWAYLGDQCREGYWFDADGQICFVYEDRPDAPQCWEFNTSGGRLSATFVDSADGRELYEAHRSKDPLVCLGPKVGV